MKSLYLYIPGEYVWFKTFLVRIFSVRHIWIKFNNKIIAIIIVNNLLRGYKTRLIIIVKNELLFVALKQVILFDIFNSSFN